MEKRNDDDGEKKRGSAVVRRRGSLERDDLRTGESLVASAGGSGSTVDGDSHEDENRDGEDLDEGKEKLGFAVTSSTT